MSLEKEIIALFKDGDPRAMESIFRLYHKTFCYFAKQLVLNDEQAEDIVADAFLKLWKKNSDFESLAGIKAFMYVTIRNSCCNYLKQMQRRSISHREIFHLMRKDENYIESKMIKADLLHLILQEVESLPPVRRKIFKMIFLDDLSIYEIAEQLNITMDTVRVQKARALNCIRTVVLRKSF